MWVSVVFRGFIWVFTQKSGGNGIGMGTEILFPRQPWHELSSISICVFFSINRSGLDLQMRSCCCEVVSPGLLFSNSRLVYGQNNREFRTHIPALEVQDLPTAFRTASFQTFL